MEDEVFKKELEELLGMLKNLRLRRDREQRRKFKAEIRVLLTRVMKDSTKNLSPPSPGGELRGV